MRASLKLKRSLVVISILVFLQNIGICQNDLPKQASPKETDAIFVVADPYPSHSGRFEFTKTEKPWLVVYPCKDENTTESDWRPECIRLVTEIEPIVTKMSNLWEITFVK